MFSTSDSRTSRLTGLLLPEIKKSIFMEEEWGTSSDECVCWHTMQPALKTLIAHAPKFREHTRISNHYRKKMLENTLGHKPGFFSRRHGERLPKSYTFSLRDGFLSLKLWFFTL